jgi:hypothetical protein
MPQQPRLARESKTKVNNPLQEDSRRRQDGGRCSFCHLIRDYKNPTFPLPPNFTATSAPNLAGLASINTYG